MFPSPAIPPALFALATVMALVTGQFVLAAVAAASFASVTNQLVLSPLLPRPVGG